MLFVIQLGLLGRAPPARDVEAVVHQRHRTAGGESGVGAVGFLPTHLARQGVEGIGETAFGRKEANRAVERAVVKQHAAPDRPARDVPPVCDDALTCRRGTEWLSDFKFDEKVETLIGNRIIYPDGTVNSFVQRYLREKVPGLFNAKPKRSTRTKRTA